MIAIANNTHPLAYQTADSDHQYSQLLLLSTVVMTLSICVVIASIMIGYLYPQYFTMETQISAHIATLLFATAAKIGYIMRCVARAGLGQMYL
jgi:nitrate reductase gamma subunit